MMDHVCIVIQKFLYSFEENTFLMKVTLNPVHVKELCKRYKMYNS